MPLISDDDILELDQTLPINQAAIEALLGNSVIEHFPKKGIIVRPGELAKKLFYIVRGSVTVAVEDDEGNNIVLAYLNEGDFIGEIGLFYKVKHTNATVRARTACELAEIEYEKLHKLFESRLRDQHADIMTAIGQQLAQRLLRTSRRVTRLAHMDVAGRIARTLLDLCTEPEALSHPEGTQIHVSRQEIGRLSGCSRESVGRVLKQMAEDGMIEVSGMNIVVYHSR